MDPRLQFDDAYPNDADEMPNQLVKGMCFKDIKYFRATLPSFHILQSRSFAYKKNKMHNVKVHCMESNCEFYPFA